MTTKSARSNRPRSDGPRPLLVSMADLARRRGCHKSSVSRACAAGGVLRPAMHRDRVDIAHPVVRAWMARGRATARESPLSGAAGLPEDVRFGSQELFAARAEGVEPRTLSSGDGRIDLSAPAVLERLAARPFRRGPYDASELQADWLEVPDEWISLTRREPDGPFRFRGVLMRAYLARLIGAVPTADDEKGFERAQSDYAFTFDDRIRRH